MAQHPLRKALTISALHEAAAAQDQRSAAQDGQAAPSTATASTFSRLSSLLTLSNPPTPTTPNHPRPRQASQPPPAPAQEGQRDRVHSGKRTATTGFEPLAPPVEPSSLAILLNDEATLISPVRQHGQESAASASLLSAAARRQSTPRLDLPNPSRPSLSPLASPSLDASSSAVFSTSPSSESLLQKGRKSPGMAIPRTSDARSPQRSPSKLSRRRGSYSGDDLTPGANSPVAVESSPVISPYQRQLNHRQRLRESSASLRTSYQVSQGSRAAGGALASLIGIAQSPEVDSGLLAVVGRTVLKILHVSHSRSMPSEASNPKVTMSSDVQRGSKLGKGYIMTDIQWGFADTAHKLATPCSNGNVLIWDLSREGPKLDQTKVKHDRAVNRVAFGGQSGGWLLSAGQDGQIKLWDARTAGGAIGVLSTPSDPVRDVSFTPNALHTHFAIASCTESGMIYRWDLRAQLSPTDKVQGHVGGAICMTWKPPDSTSSLSGGWLATGGIDKSVKIWDLSRPSLSSGPLRTLYTARPTHSLTWRPESIYELAATPADGVSMSTEALAYGPELDISKTAWQPDIEVWDIRRPHLPKYQFSTGQGPSVGALFPSREAIWSAHRSSSFVQLDIQRDAQSPASYLTAPAVARGPFGDFALSLRSGAPAPDAFELDEFDHAGLQSVHKDSASASGQSTAFVKDLSMGFDVARFSSLATGLSLLGDSPAELAKANAKLAASLGLHNLSRLFLCVTVWLRMMAESVERDEAEPNAALEQLESESSSSRVRRSISRHGANRRDSRSRPRSHLADFQEAEENTSEAESDRHALASISAQSDLPESDSESEQRSFAPPGRMTARGKLRSPPSTASTPTNARQSLPSLAALGSAVRASSRPASKADIDGDSSDSASDEERFRFSGKGSAMRRLASSQLSQPRSGRPRTRHGFSSSATVQRLAESRHTHASSHDGSQLRLSIWRDKSTMPSLSPVDAAASNKEDLLALVDGMRQQLHAAALSFAEEGDVQLATTLISMLSPAISFETTFLRRISFSYLGLLRKLNLHLTAAAVIKSSRLDAVRETAQVSTMLHMACGRCQKALAQPPYGICRRCRQGSGLMHCSICELPMTGVITLCATCGHGSHATCIVAYLSDLSAAFLQSKRPEAVDASLNPVMAALLDSKEPMPLNYAEREEQADLLATCPSGCGHTPCLPRTAWTHLVSYLHGAVV
ncbi:uncharacterized protein L969DRAFT_17629 [Mixia osmundae IAM 14324]|uniref:Uncharacterized protein n=1 Tax=Mixia osmundae (strain CBS 9802 / IAM 14324 / JCM 22182 / KY 12970) TaxID=764103 RepID=G7E462_MIXOS|nr:uncharacterized protein L969DRAFT_17629 [Mixia osmundae IAM 14324]KEI39718.1 hypothetical protein L969DRAFT_17629 [Mixia osmundae IAM 14324]GAA97622.1 hypothetical protein E5Q_04300 [Mixia osmundae IAM 14324]